MNILYLTWTLGIVGLIAFAAGSYILVVADRKFTIVCGRVLKYLGILLLVIAGLTGLYIQMRLYTALDKLFL